jgi:hypothetical protein
MAQLLQLLVVNSPNSGIREVGSRRSVSGGASGCGPLKSTIAAAVFLRDDGRLDRVGAGLRVRRLGL